MDCTVVDKHKGVEKCGYLQKQCFKRLLFPYWKRRYFVLCKGKLYSYDSEDYKLNDKNRAVLDLKYFYFIYEAHPDECKKYKESNIFIVSAQDISLFDPTRYMLAADSKEEMLDWMERLKTTVESVKNRKLDLNGSSVNQILVSPSAGDVKHVQTNYTTGSPSFPNKPTVKPEDGLPAMELKPLDNITRTRVKGPSGRRAPRNRHSMQPRSSSLVQLNPIGNADNQRSASVHESRNRLSVMMTISEISFENCSNGTSPVGQISVIDEIKFDDIENDLFFEKPIPAKNEPMKPSTVTLDRNTSFLRVNFNRLRKSIRRSRLPFTGSDKRKDNPPIADFSYKCIII